MTTRAEWQQLAEDRILDAQVFLTPGVDRWSAAYYLVGYAVECGLKSCVMARLIAHPEIVYQTRNFSNDAWTHDFEKLLLVADIKADRDADILANRIRFEHWQRVRKWDESARYQQKSFDEARLLFDAVNDPNDGVMQWIRKRW